MTYTTREIERVARAAFDVAMKRRRKLASVDKSNVLIVSQLWREVVNRVAADYPAVELEHILVDNCAMALVQHPTRFDTIVTENTFGDILSDEAAILAGSMGMLPSASLGGTVGLYEPVHGTAPDIAGKGLANPIAAILSASMLLRYSLDRGPDADRIDAAVLRVLEQGHRTRDINDAARQPVGTGQMGDLIAARSSGRLTGRRGHGVGHGGRGRRRDGCGRADHAEAPRGAQVPGARACGPSPRPRSAARPCPSRRDRQGGAVGPDSFKGVELALFSAGSAQSKEYAPLAVKAGAVVSTSRTPSAWSLTSRWWCRRSTLTRVKGHRGSSRAPNCTRSSP
jgi:hypothetical protein